MMRVHVSQRLNVVVQGLPYLPYMYVTTGFDACQKPDRHGLPDANVEALADDPRSAR